MQALAALVPHSREPALAALVSAYGEKFAARESAAAYARVQLGGILVLRVRDSQKQEEEEEEEEAEEEEE